MKIINLPRGRGKTTRLLYASEFNNIPIICGTKVHKEYLLYKAKELDLKIPEPIVISEIPNPSIFDGTHFTDNGVLVDDAEWLLQQLLQRCGVRGKIKAITLTGDENER